MANLDNLPVADINTTAENTASTPTPSRAGSRARRKAEAKVDTAETVTETTTDQPVGETSDLGLPPREDAAPLVETGSTDQPASDGAIEGLPERVESDNTVQVEEPKAPTKLLILAAKNPKRNPSIAYGFFQKYYGTGENNRLTTIDEAFERGVRGKDLSWDKDRGHILIGDDVDAYLALETDEARAEWLVAKFKDMPKDKLLKMVGIALEAPKVAEEAVEKADAAGEVKAESEPGATDQVKAEIESEPGATDQVKDKLLKMVGSEKEEATA